MISSTCLQASLCSACYFSVWHLAHKSTHDKAFPASRGLWRPIPTSQGTFSWCLLANKGLSELNILQVSKHTTNRLILLDLTTTCISLYQKLCSQKENGQLAHCTVWPLILGQLCLNYYYGTDCSGKNLSHCGCGVPMGTVSLEKTILKDWPCIWHHILCSTPKMGANGRVSFKYDRETLTWFCHMLTLRGNRLRIKAVWY